MSPRKTTKTTKLDVATKATSALDGLKAMTATLPIDDSIPPNQMAATRVSNRVPLEAMMIAVGVLNSDPGHFPQFDAGDAQAAIDYEKAMIPVAQAALVLSKRITRSVVKRRSAMAHQTLALYQVMKGTARLATNEETRTQVLQLKKIFTTSRRSRETDVTQKETEVLVKTRKSAKKQALAQTRATQAVNDAAAAAAQATLDAAVAAGTVSQLTAPAMTPTPTPPPAAVVLTTAPPAPSASAAPGH